MSAEKEGGKINAAKELKIFIKGLKTDKATLLKLVDDVMPTAYNLAALVSEASKNNFGQLGQLKEEERDEIKKLAEDILLKLDDTVPEANLLEGTGIERKKSRVYTP